MTYKEFIDMHISYLAEHPSYANKEAVYAIDDEGNGYNSMYITQPCYEEVTINYDTTKHCVIIN